MITQEKHNSFDWGTVLLWGFATTMGLVISDGFQAYFIRPNSLLSFFIPGIAIGILQWIYFNLNKIKNASIWIWVTIFGWALSWFVGSFSGSIANLLLGVINGTLAEGDVINVNSGPLGFPVQVIVHGTLLGIIQWVFFMRKRFNSAAWWIPATSFGWAISILIGWLIIPAISQIIGWNESGLEDSVIRGAIFGLTTGLVLQWLLKRPFVIKDDMAINTDNLT